MRGIAFRFAGVAISVVCACGGVADSDGQVTSTSPVTTVAPVTSAQPVVTTTGAPTTFLVTTTTASPATTAIPPTTAPPEPAIEVSGDGVVTVDWAALSATPFFAAPVASASDPFFLIHSDPATDGFFLSIEAYTVYGTAWTGQTGQFEVGCAPSASGICMYLDVDGPGAIPVAGSNFDATGSVTIVQLDESGYEVILENIVFSEGYSIPGPLTLSG